MDALLLDTDVFSCFFRQDDRRLPYRDDLRGRVLCISFASVAELRFGAVRAGWGASRRRGLEGTLLQYIMLVPDAEVTEHWAVIKAGRDKIGRPIASEDCWIAATAVRHGIPLVTHNRKDFEQIPNLKLIWH
jgi:tRNA(fMet)-specific endonuclease VapC